MVILGLETENMLRMMDNRPVALDLGPLGVPGVQLMIFHGTDEEDLRRKFAELTAEGLSEGMPADLPGSMPVSLSEGAELAPDAVGDIDQGSNDEVPTRSPARPVNGRGGDG